ncbi:cytochrome c oxidase accessory protein CcoG [Chitinibacter fontanus]|uniref:Cytochrome c oxidase accessory protein CcoG n=1 Tax=Chitinibacter fontanus TaxID=1737446 RepID=A0A7D5Z934_9NEIS|nr:cytochrome c oxidase accessory protein CcoG [Chitinibacter fontanus]QLI80685.1 cytochrome c oxidase accessory protein CcoG [Chitinibacter fontanus]
MNNSASQSAAQSSDVQTIHFHSQKKIYPRWVTGYFNNWRIFFVVATQLFFYGVPWLEINGRQALLFDIANSKFYIFGLVFLPQDFIYLMALLLVSAFGLFVWTAIGGRLWCGYACPQTVYTEIFLWIEKWTEGDRSARIKLDQAPLSARKIGIKTLKHSIWIALSLWTGLTFVAYFTPMSELQSSFATLSMGPWDTFWILFYGLATYGNAGWLREQVCQHMCPYSRFQSTMFDKDTLIISYDTRRGEPRGARSMGSDYQLQGLGECVSCTLCVQVCPVGIDIRDGLQYECIGCTACIDACDQVMDKVGYPRGLIRYTTANELENPGKKTTLATRLRRPQVLLFGSMLLAVIAASAYSLHTHQPIKANIIRERNTLVRELANGELENVYRVQLQNTAEQSRSFNLQVSGLPGLSSEIDQNSQLALSGTESREFIVRVKTAATNAKAGAHPIQFHLRASDDTQVQITEAATFFGR